jgi:hypothetical protein
MEVNILIKYEDGIYTEMSKVFDADRPEPAPGLNAFFITFYYDDKIYSKKVVNEYLNIRGLKELIGYFMSTTSKVQSTPETSNTPRFRIAIQSLLAAIKYPDWQNVHYLLKYLSGGFKSRQYELQTVPEELKITTGYKVLCHSENDISFMFSKNDVHIPQLANFIN